MSKKNIKVLGIHAVGHETGACIIANGKICAISEERLSRKKYDGAFPYLSINYVLSESGIKDLNDIDLIVTDYIDRRTEEGIRKIRELGYSRNLIPIRHHDAHAASAFFVSPFDDASILIVDGCGSWGNENEPGKPAHYLHTIQEAMTELQSIYRGDDIALHLIRRTVATRNYRMGIGFFYAFSTMYLGFYELEGGKLMGLASYGKGSKKFKKKIFTNFDGELLVEGNKNYWEKENWEYYGKKYFSGLPPREYSEKITKEHMEIAHFVQKKTEEAMIFLAKNLHNITKCPNLCIAGGVGLNCRANTAILKNTPFENIFIQPACSDSGIPLGCALYGYHVLMKMPREFVMNNAFLGREYSNEEILIALKSFKGIKCRRSNNLFREVAKYISSGKIIGWFEGRSELGPRALGHRSILADARNPKMKDMLNTKVKHREPFRPYAPSVMEEYAHEYFDLHVSSPFMLLVGKVRENKISKIPAVTHIDKTARIQTVNPVENKRFYEIHEEFYKLTGVPVLLNTSFNMHGEPIVETPEDALRCFLKTEMDYLVLQDYLVSKAR